MFLINDYKTLSWKRILFTGLLTGLFCIMSFLFFDKVTHIWAIKLNNGFWETITEIGKWTNIMCASILCLTVSYIFNKNKLKKISFYIFVSVLSAGFVVQILKIFIGRLRPLFFDALGNYGFDPFSFSDAYFSMPSGHAAAVFSMFIMLGLLFTKYKVFACCFAILISVSRLFVGAHYLSDIFAGIFIGSVMADIVFYYLNNHKKYLKYIGIK